MKKSLSDTDVFLRTSRADDPHREIKAQLAHFLLALIQAFLRTGYYTSDHPEKVFSLKGTSSPSSFVRNAKGKIS